MEMNNEQRLIIKKIQKGQLIQGIAVYGGLLLLIIIAVVTRLIQGLKG